MAPEHLPAYVQLEDHEWTRVALGLVESEPVRPLGWRLDADTVSGEMGSRSGPLVPPPPLVAGSTKGSWVMMKDGASIRALPPTPRVLSAGRQAGLVTIWQRGGIRCFLDVIAVGSLSIDGPPVAAGCALSDVIIELGSRRWSDLDEVYLVGFGRELHGLEDIRFLPEVADALALLRESDPDRSPARCFVVAPAPPRSGERGNLASLLELARVFPRAAVVCCDSSLPVNAIWRLAARHDTLHVEVRRPLGSIALFDPREDRDPQPDASRRPVEPQSRAAETATARALNESAFPRDSLAARFSASPFVVPKEAAWLGEPARAGLVEVRVLGSIDILGTAEQVDHRPLITELLVYLAFHRDGIARESFGAALWPERRIPLQTVSNRLHEARRVLGVGSDERSRLRRVQGRLRLTDDVVTDWDRFGELTCEGSGPQSWRMALALVRGRPFSGLTQAEWTVLEGHVAAIERSIVETSLALGQHYLEASNGAGAEWAAHQGLLAAPWDERLYRLLMHAAEAAGNRGGIDSALRALAQVLELRGDPLLGVHPSTAQLYRRLTGNDHGNSIGNNGNSPFGHVSR